MNFSLVLAQQAPAGPSAIVQLLPIVLIAVVFYLLVFRPMKVRQRKLEATIRNLKAGDRVITSGGVYGTIAGIKEKTFLLRVSDQVKIEVAKSAISGMQSEEDSGS
ncbi:MAG: preprotein translocase subunit YajC [Acidobacteria bacterium]|nr:preprotein translocase subunit YajC [Acidobacteriota bacterium]